MKRFWGVAGIGVASVALAVVLTACGARPLATATNDVAASDVYDALRPPAPYHTYREMYSLPFSWPTTQLVVPHDRIPQIEPTKGEVRDAVRLAFGSLLESVSVEAAFLGTYDDGGGKQIGFRIEYRLVGCDTPVITYAPTLNDTGILPPITQLENTPPARDVMSAVRFRVLLAAYGRTVGGPFGALESYRSAAARAVKGVDPSGYTTDFGPTPRPIDDLWVVTPGAVTRHAYTALRYNSDTPGYVFDFPVGGPPTYLGRVEDLGETAPLGD